MLESEKLEAIKTRDQLRQLFGDTAYLLTLLDTITRDTEIDKIIDDMLSRSIKKDKEVSSALMGAEEKTRVESFINIAESLGITGSSNLQEQLNEIAADLRDQVRHLKASISFIQHEIDGIKLDITRRDK